MRFYLLLILTLVASPAFAADEPRKIDFTTVLNDPDGEPLQECIDPPDCKTKKAMTLGYVAMKSLVMAEAGLGPDESLKRGHLAISVYKSTGAQLTAEEVALIKRQIAKGYSPLVAVRAFVILDPASAK